MTQDNNYIPGGFVLLSRKIIESEIWNMPPMYLKVWTYIITKARHKAEGNFERGELLLSIPELQEACSHKVGYRTVKPKKHEIDNILRWLRKTHEGEYGHDTENDNGKPMITTTKTTRGMVVKVSNYSVYQNPKNYEYDNEKDDKKASRTATGTTIIRQQYDTIHKNDKNVNKFKDNGHFSNDSELENQFNTFWDEYDKKKSKQTAFKSFKKAIKKHEFQIILDGAKKQKLERPDKQYRPDPTTFLNQERYLDEFEIKSHGSNGSENKSMDWVDGL